jgi:hypothetical protein
MNRDLKKNRLGMALVALFLMVAGMVSVAQPSVAVADPILSASQTSSNLVLASTHTTVAPVKGKPPVGGISSRAACTTTCYTYAGRYQVATTGGATANLRIENPYCSSTCYHSLAEVAVQNIGSGGGTGNTVEIGWTHDALICGQSTSPCLFVFAWINGVGQTYNGGTWVTNTTYCSTVGAICAGAALPTGVAKEFTMVYDATTPAGGAWWGKYNGNYIGYFPSSTWGSGVFTTSTKVQFFGELAHSTTVPCSDMGQGTFGSTAALPATYFGSVSYFSGPTVALTDVVTNSAWYNVGVASARTFYFGGPGSGGIVGGC